MVGLYIPTIGSRLKLSSDLEFTLYAEYRNASIMDALGYTDYFSHWSLCDDRKRVENLIHEARHFPSIVPGFWTFDEEKHLYGLKVRIPHNTVLTVDRYYLRKGNSAFDSLSFNITYCPLPNLCPKNGFSTMGGKKASIPLVRGTAKRARFWMTLEDANKIQFDENFKGDFIVEGEGP